MNRCKKLSRRCLGIMFILYIGIMIALNIITPDRVFSDSENRNLEQRPKFTFDKLIHGKFTKDYEKYVADQFTMRDFFIGVKSDVERVTGKKENNGVYIGSDGYLMQKFNMPEEKKIKEKMNGINSFSASIPKTNKYFMLVPGSVEILSGKLPSFAPCDDERLYLDKVKGYLDKDINFVDVYDTLNCKKDEYIFYKTDHHWTSKGAYYAYNKLCTDMNIKPHDESYFDIKKVTDEFYGSLYSKGGFRHINPDSIELYIPKADEECKVDYVDENRTLNSIYDMDCLNKKDKYTVFLGGNHSLVKITSNASNKKKLLVVKDSYANSFIPFLTGHYSEIYVVDLRYYNEDLKDLVNKNKINDILFLYSAGNFIQ